MGKILVLGSTGTVGSLLFSRLEERGEKIKGATRRPEEASKMHPKREYVAFDFEDETSFAPALKEVDRVFLIARPGDPHPERVAIPLIDEMKKKKISKVINLTAMGIESQNDLTLRQVETYLEASGIDFTHLRPNWFMQVLANGPLFQDIQRTGSIHLPAEESAISYVDVRDVAEVAATILSEGGHFGKAYTLTGARALDHFEIARLLSDAAGKEIRYVPISEEQAREGLEAAGLSLDRVERLIGFYRLIRKGFCSPVSAEVETVLARPPISFEQFSKDHAACWR